MINWRCLLDILLIFIILFASWLMMTLLNFSPFDSNWSQTVWINPIHKTGITPGVWLSDILFFIFGVTAYIIPVVIIGNCWFVWQNCQNSSYTGQFFTTLLHLIGMIVFILTSCGLVTAINADDIWHFAFGGVIGSLLTTLLKPLLYDDNCIIALFFIWTIGLIVFIGCSFMRIVEKIGNAVLSVLSFISKRKYNGDMIQIHSKDENKYDGNSKKVLLKINHESYFLIILHNLLMRCKYIFKSFIKLLRYKHNVVLSSGKSMDDDPVLYDTCKVVANSDGILTSGNYANQLEYDKQDSLSNNPSTTKLINTAKVSTSSAQKYKHNTAVKLIIQQSSNLINIDLKPNHCSPAQQNKYRSSIKQEQLTSWYQNFPKLVNVSTRRTIKKLIANRDLMPDISSITSAIVRDSNISIDKNISVPIFDIPACSKTRPQIKNGIGPQLPRPNRIRIPTRRELTSYNIKLASQQMKGKKTSVINDVKDSAEIRQFLLTRQFCTLKERGYSYKECNKVNQVPISDFKLSPTNKLIDNAMNEPIFTPNAISDPESSRIFTPVLHTKARKLTVQQFIYRSSNIFPQQQPSHQNDHLPIQSQERLIVNTSLVHSNNAYLLTQKSTALLLSLDLLKLPPVDVGEIDTFALEEMAHLIEARLADFRIKADVVNYSLGPVITRFELNLAPGVKVARISNLSRDLARSLSTVALRVVEVIPGKPYVGLELPNKKRQTVYLREVLNNDEFRDNQSPLTVVLGKDITGSPVVMDLAKMPHLLVAGTTGSGKSVGINAMILSMLYKATPEEVRFIMIDPKMLELSIYDGIPHLLTEVITDMKDADNALRWSIHEMERRYRLMSALGVRNLAGYNKKIIETAVYADCSIQNSPQKIRDLANSQYYISKKLPYIVVLIDEFADLIMTLGKKVENLIIRLAQKARAAGIHLVLATQRPSVNIITGLIKANIPTRIAFTVSSKIDSHTILNQSGAESLLGMGDMLYSGPDSSTLIRIHGAFVHDSEVHSVVQDLKARYHPQYIDCSIPNIEGKIKGDNFDNSDEKLDPLFNQAVSFVTEKHKASISSIQRQFRIGYNRAARIIKQMEIQGIVSKQNCNGNREVLIPLQFE